MRIRRPKSGDKRTIVKFAWWPTTIKTDEGRFTIWLERYIVEQKFETLFMRKPNWVDQKYSFYSKLYKTMYVTEEKEK